MIVKATYTEGRNDAVWITIHCSCGYIDGVSSYMTAHVRTLRKWICNRCGDFDLRFSDEMIVLDEKITIKDVLEYMGLINGQPSVEDIL